jgi:hypothetical protein
MATVTSCTFDAGAGQALAFGIASGKHFLIAFNYWAGEELHTGVYSSATAVPQGTLFPISYDPDATHEHSHSRASAGTGGTVLRVALAGSVVLAIAYLVVLRGCL